MLQSKTFLPTDDLQWYSFSWSRMRSSSDSDQSENDSQTDITEIEAWYTPCQCHGPSEYWGLPGLILELSAGQTTMLCTKVVINLLKRLKLKLQEKGLKLIKMVIKILYKRKWLNSEIIE